MKAGFIGLGNMGGPMARNLARAGFPLTVYNRTRSKAEALAGEGARVAKTPADVAREADIVLSCLATVEATREVFLERNGILEGTRQGQVLVDHGTVDLETTRLIHQEAKARGASFLDAPISGGPEGAERATLAIMCGGDPAGFERARPLFEAMGETVVLMGPSGAGTATKLANQLLVGVHTLASCEALLLARRAGVESEKLLAVLEKSWGASRMLLRNAPVLLEGKFTPSGAPLRNLHKDLAIVTELARKTGLSVPAAETAERLYGELLAEGKGEWDITAAALRMEGEGSGEEGV